ncbi:hypothetical protein AA0Z99_04320 [Agrococcus sp. 1P02AA]|uniref:hypothetical protein n=1 Tax=Agrococcus sp. 1P02AA TaxID=3132259 RepID=UPI0039A48DCC
MDDKTSRAHRADQGTGDSPDDELLDEIAALVQHGIVPRLWIFIVGADGSLRRDLQQIDGIPVSPDAHAVLALRGIIGFLLEEDEAVVCVIERPAGAEPSPDDWAWHDAIVAAARGLPGALRGVLLAHRAGVASMG